METKKELIEKRNEHQCKAKDLQEQIDNFKEVLEVGKWYKNKGCIACFEGNGADGYGFNRKNEWRGKGSQWFKGSDGSYIFEGYLLFKDWTLATDKEVEEALIKEAKKRGFKEGVCINNVMNGMLGNIKEGVEFSYNNVTNRLYLIDCVYDNKANYGSSAVNNKYTIFNNGKWAEIIEDKVPEINGCKMEVDGDYHVKFGCARFSKIQLSEWNKALQSDYGDGNRRIKSMTLDSGVEITVGQLKEVVDYLNK